MINFGATYWDYYFSKIFVQQINALQYCLTSRTLVSFDNLGEESNKIAKEEFSRLGERPVDEDNFTDVADLAEMAQEKAIDYYTIMSNMKHALIGLFTSGLFHLFEQQIFLFYNRALLEYGEEKAKISDVGWKKLKSRLKSEGIDLDSLKFFQEIDILRLVANVIKHAEGWSADELKKFKPDYFKPDKSILPLEIPSYLEIQVELPLTGEDIKIPSDDFIQYCEDVKAFWRELGERLIEISENSKV
jgi:hypothetical protein